MNVNLNKRRVELISLGLRALVRGYEKQLSFNPSNRELLAAKVEVEELLAMVERRLEPLPELENFEV